MSSLINRTAVRSFTLDTLKRTRPHLAEKQKRFSKDYDARIEAKVRALIINEVAALPTVGATIR